MYKRKKVKKIMKLFDFMILVKKRKKLVFSVVIISFLAMLLFTIFLNDVNYGVSAKIKLSGNILLTSSGIIDTSDKTYNRIDLKLNQLDDKSAMEYVQNNKSFFDQGNTVDYQQVVFNINSIEFMNSEINSYSFKSYLVAHKIITGFKQVNIVEQTDSLSIRVISDDPQKTKEIYEKVIACIPQYIEEKIYKKIGTANTAIKASIKSDQDQADRLINQYAKLKNDTEFSDIVNLNKGIEILNSLSSLSNSINANSSVSNKFDKLMSNKIAPDLILKNVDFSGLKFTRTLISYIIIEIIASVLIGFLAAFIAECHSKIKKYSK